jgi:hypothetical protein
MGLDKVKFLETVVTDETLEAIKHWQQFSLIQL